MLSLNDILFGVLVPFILSGVALALGGRSGKEHRWAGPLAIGLAFTAAFGLLEGAAQLFPPASAVPWLFYLGLLFTLVGLVDAAIRMPRWLRPIVVSLATLLGGALVLRFNFTNHTWDAVHGLVWLIGVAVVGVIWWNCFESVAGEPGVIMPLGAMLIVGVAGLVVMLAATQIIGQALGALAIALAAAAGVMLWLKEVSLTRGASVVVSGVGVCALAAAYFLADVPILDLSLVAVAPLLLAGSGWIPQGRRPWLRVVVRMAIVLIPLGTALGLAVAQFQKEAAEKSADPYSMVPLAIESSST